MNIKKYGIAMLLVFLMVMLTMRCSDTGTNSSKSIVYVDGGYRGGQQDGSKERPYTSIYNAVYNAGEGATIIVMPGGYTESLLTLKKGQRLISQTPEKAVLTSSNKDIHILQLFDCHGCEVSNFKFEMDTYRALGRPIKCKNSDRIKILNNYFQSNGPHLELCNGLVSNNKMRGDVGINSIPMSNSGELIIENNDVYVISTFPIIGPMGMQIMGPINSARTVVRGNKISGVNSVGIDITCSANAVLENNIIKDNANYGIAVSCFGGPYSWGMIDLGGGPGGSKGGNIIQNNATNNQGGFDLINGADIKIYAKYNKWDHNTASDIDAYDIKDDDEGVGGEVIFEPFSSSALSHNLYHNNRRLYDQQNYTLIYDLLALASPAFSTADRGTDYMESGSILVRMVRSIRQR